MNSLDMKLCVLRLAAVAVTLALLGGLFAAAGVACSAPQRAAERTAISDVEAACPVVGAGAVLVVPNAVDVTKADTICLTVDEAGEFLKRILARRKAAQVALDAGGDAAVAPLPPCGP